MATTETTPETTTPTSNMDVLRTDSERFLQEAIKTGENLRRHDENGSAAESPMGVLVEACRGLLVVTCEFEEVTARGVRNDLAVKAVFGPDENTPGEIFELRIGDEGWGDKTVKKRQQEKIAGELIKLLYQTP